MNTDTANQKADKSGYDSNFAWVASYLLKEPVVPLTVLIFFANALLAYVSIQQHRQTRIVQRAYLSVEPLGIGRKERGPWFATIGIHNAGRLPARDVRWSVGIEPFMENDGWRDFSHTMEMRDGPVVPPGATVRRGSNRFEFDENSSGERFMYVWGEVAYTDGFGQPRSTRYCHRYNSRALSDAPGNGRCILPEDSRYHDHGNEAT